MKLSSFSTNRDLQTKKKSLNRGGELNSAHTAGSRGPGALGGNEHQLWWLPNTKGPWKHMGALGSGAGTQEVALGRGEGWGSAPLPPHQSSCHSQLTRRSCLFPPAFFPIKKCKLKIYCINLYNCQLFLQEKGTEFLNKKPQLFNY